MKGRKIFVMMVALAWMAAAQPFAGTRADGNDKWKQIDSLIGQVQYATAYPLAQGYYRQALAGDNGPELITAAFYLAMLDYGYGKDAVDSAIMRYSLLACRLQGVDRAVAYTFLYDTYSQLYAKYRWRIDRNKPSDDPKLKYSNWHTQRMVDTLMRCADSVLAYADLLRTADIKPYSRLFAADTAVQPPMDSSLLGILVQTLLLDNNYVKITKTPASMRQWFLKPLPAFVGEEYTDNLSHPGDKGKPTQSSLPYPFLLHHRVAKLYDSAPADIMLWLDLQRFDLLDFDSCILAVIDSLTAYYQPRLTSPEMKALLAFYRAQYLSYDKQEVLAEQVCLETEKAYPNTYGARRCRVLRLYDICKTEFKITYSNCESSQRSRLAYVDAHNVSRLNFRIVKSINLDSKLNEQQIIDTLMTLTPVKEWQQTLPDSGDHLWHQYLIAFPPVPQGDYYLLAFADSVVCYSGAYYSSDATFIMYQTPATGGLFQLSTASGHLVDRLTGQPLQGKRVTIHGVGELTYKDYRRHSRTDKQGYYHFPATSPIYGLIEYSNISAQMDGYEYFPKHSLYYSWVWTSMRERTQTKFLDIVMLDRPVYRLGDTVRFSCVAYRRHLRGKEQSQHIRPSKHLKLIAIFGRQYEDEQDTLRLTTDEHGRCWGEFVIPADGQNGSYRLTVEEPNYGETLFVGYHTSQTVQVEAYKPPHFMVTLQRDTATDLTSARTPCRFGQPITLYGSAISYSGAPMTGAKVKWEVSCEKMADPLQAFTVANDYPYSDSLTVDDDGNFQFTFTPILENTSKTSSTSNANTRKETRIYTAYARVIDSDGELHEQHLSFHVSDADGYCIPTSTDLSHLTFAYNNFDGQPLEGAVQVELYQLRQPDTIRTLDTLMKAHPEAQWVGTRGEFQRLFPYRAFSREEGDRHSWPVVAKRADTVTTERTLTFSNLPSGLYRIVFHTPDSNQHDTLVNYVAPNSRVTGDDIVYLRTTPQRDWGYQNTLTCRVGDTVRIELGSPYGNQPLFYRVFYAAKIYQRGMMVLDNSHTSTLLIPITRKMTDGCVVQLSAVREGRTFAPVYDIHVAQPDRVLSISTETLRDHLQPGDHETWTFRVTNTDSVGLPANLSMSLYDFSLEQQYGRLQYGFWPWYRYYQSYRTMIPTSDISYFNSPSSQLVVTSTMSSTSQPHLGFSLFNQAEYYNQLLHLFGGGRFRGVVTDAKTQEFLPFVNVAVKSAGRVIKVTQSDFDGNFSFRDLLPGKYDVEFSYVGYHKFVQSVVINTSNIIVWNVQLQSSATTLDCVEISESRIPMIEIGAPERGARMSADDIAQMPGTTLESIVASLGGVGNARGENGMVTMQGGVRKRTGVNVPKEAIAEISPMFNFGSSADDRASAMRKNLSTLAFFEPALRSDNEGRVSISFTLPDALTQWQLQGIAWSDQFQIGALSRTIQSQKELMVQPLMPRFLRQGDTIEIRAKVSNLTDSVMTVLAGFQFASADTLHHRSKQQANYLNVSPHSSAISSMRFAIPDDWHMAEYKVYAEKTSTTGGHHADGEQGILPVLSNRERITTSYLIYVPGSVDGKEVVRTFDIALPTPAPGDSTTLSFTTNPIKYAIEALPHFKRLLMPGNIYLANSIYVNHLTTLLDTLSPKERQRVASRVTSDLHRILGAQASGGGWSWMPGGREASRYVTESVLQRLATCPSLDNQNNYYHNQYLKAIGYLDKLLVDINKKMLIYSHPWFYDCLSLIYTRSFYFNIKPLDQCDSTTQEAYRFCYQLCRMHSLETKSLHTQGQLALLMLHMGDTADAVRMAKRIKGTAHTSDDQGMYWLNNVSGYGWYDRPIETAALLVDVFADVLHDWESVNRIQQWILASKRGTAWHTDMATAAALRALTRQPDGNKVNSGKVGIKINNEELTVKNDASTTDLSSPERYRNCNGVCTIQLTSTSHLPAWGALFHSHDTPVDSIQYNGTGMKLRKTLSRVNNDGSLTLLNPGDKLRVGDRVRVHIDIDCQLGFDNMVLRDQRASAFEPVSTTSGWQWNDGLHYYVDVRDEWTDCYIDYLAPEHYYVEYDLWVRHSGTFANGICSLQSVYAPEYRANTSSVAVRVE